MDEVIKEIEALPNNGRVYVDAGGRGQIATNITTAKLKALIQPNHMALQIAYQEGYDAGAEAVEKGQNAAEPYLTTRL